MFLFEILGITLDLDPLFTELRNWWESLLKHLPNILLALIVAGVGYLVTNFLKRYFNKLSNRLVNDPTLSNLLSTLMTFAVGILFLLLVLSVLQLSGAVSSILGAAGVVGLAVGLAFQDPILNFFSGVQLSLRHLFRVGDLIEIDGYLGRVKEVTLRHTAIESLRGQDVMVPNKIMVQSVLTNYNKLSRRRVDISCGVSYGDDLATVREVTIAAIKESVPYAKDKDIQLFFTEFGGSSINYTLHFWLAEGKTGQADYLAAQSQAIMAVMAAYNAHDITIPFPIRTLDFGIKGGEKLAQMLPGSPANGVHPDKH